MRSSPREKPSVKQNDCGKDQREGSNELRPSSKPTQLHTAQRLSHSYCRRLQAKMENENRQTQEAIQCLYNTENGLIKDLERFLDEHSVSERRRRELLHKRWTERLWLPHQKQLQQRLSRCWTTDTKRRLSHSLQHCNSEVTNSAEMKKSPKQAWTPNSIEADSTASSRKEGQQPPRVESSLPLSSSVMSRGRIGTASSSFTNPESKTVRTTLSRSEKTSSIERKSSNYHRCDCRFSPRRSEF